MDTPPDNSARLSVLELHDHTTEVAQWGDPDRRALILLHSALLDRRVWAPVVDALLHGDHEPFTGRIVAYDLRSHGSARDAPAAASLDDLVRDLGEVIAVLGIEQATLAGLSLGGALAQRAAPELSSVIDRLVLCSTRGEFPADLMQQRANQASVHGVPALIPETMQRWLGTPDIQATMSDAVSYVRQCLLDTATDTWRSVWNLLAGFDNLERNSSFHGTVDVIVGTADGAVSQDAAQQLTNSFDAGRLTVVENGVHLCTLQYAEQVTAVIRKTP